MGRPPPSAYQLVMAVDAALLERWGTFRGRRASVTIPRKRQCPAAQKGAYCAAQGRSCEKVFTGLVGSISISRRQKRKRRDKSKKTPKKASAFLRDRLQKDKPLRQFPWVASGRGARGKNAFFGSKPKSGRPCTPNSCRLSRLCPWLFPGDTLLTRLKKRGLKLKGRGFQ